MYQSEIEENEWMLFPFGFGDGGGGPTRDMLEVAKRINNLEGLPKCELESPMKFFDSLKYREIKESFYGELYLSWHRGCYTSQATLKKIIRYLDQLM